MYDLQIHTHTHVMYNLEKMVSLLYTHAGRLPVRSGIYSAHDWPVDMAFRVFLPISEGGLPATEVTIPQVLKKANYKSALVSPLLKLMIMLIIEGLRTRVV